MNNLQKLQDKAGYTNKELSKKSGVSLQMINMIKRGYKGYKRITIWKIANALGVDAGDIENE